MERKKNKMFCGKCGNETEPLKRKIIEDGHTLQIHYYTICNGCGEELGIKEFFQLTDWDYLTNEELEEIKNDD
jgi:hypothetical protein